jgi:hypothetical protein
MGGNIDRFAVELARDEVRVKLSSDAMGDGQREADVTYFILSHSLAQVYNNYGQGQILTVSNAALSKKFAAQSARLFEC